MNTNSNFQVHLYYFSGQRGGNRTGGGALQMLRMKTESSAEMDRIPATDSHELWDSPSFSVSKS